MTSKLPETIEAQFGEIDDPHYHHSPPHVLLDILTITLCALISGANDWEAVAAFGRAKESWLRAFLRLPNGIPSADTFERVFAHIDPEHFRASFIRWVASLSQLTAGEGAAIDGKTLCGSVDRSNDRKAIHLVHWVLDIAFREDDSRVRRGYAAENLTVLRHMALNLLKRAHTSKLSFQNKRLRAAWDNDYLLQILYSLT